MISTVPFFIQKLLPQLVWRHMAGDAVYLTFDDGPIPEATPWVLDTLAKYEAIDHLTGS